MIRQEITKVKDPDESIVLLSFKKVIALAERKFYNYVLQENYGSITKMFTYSKEFLDKEDEHKAIMENKVKEFKQEERERVKLIKRMLEEVPSIIQKEKAQLPVPLVTHKAY